jgi:hypothetical protein
MFSVAQRPMLFLPIPPMPMPAMLSLSLGAVTPWPPSTWRGTIVNPAVTAAALARKVLRGTEGLMSLSWLPSSFIEPS